MKKSESAMDLEVILAALCGAFVGACGLFLGIYIWLYRKFHL